MSKLFKRFSGITLGLALCFGFSFSCSNKQSSNQMARAEEAVYAEAIFTSDNQQGNTSYTSSFTNTTGGFEWTVAGFNNNNNGWNGIIKCGRKNNASQASIATKNVVSDVITKATINITAITSGNVNSIKFYGGEDGSTEIESLTLSTGEKEITIPSENRAANQIYKFAFDCKSGSANGFVSIDSVKLYYDAGTPATSVSISSEYYQPVEKVVTIEKGDGGGSDCDELSALVLPENADDRSVTWSSNNDSVAQVDEFGYVVIDTSAVGQATITATANGGKNVSDYVIYSVINSSGTEYDITTNVTNGTYSGANKIKEESSATVTISANSGYSLPDTVTVSGATLVSYNSNTGEIVISNPTGNVSISASCATYLNSTSLVEGLYYITYTENKGAANETKYYVSSINSTGKTTTKRTEAMAFNFSLVGNDTWNISDNDASNPSFINIGNSSTSISLGSASPLTISWFSKEDGSRTISGATREFAWYLNNHEFRSYAFSTTDATHGVFLESAKEVDGFSVFSEGANKNVLKDSNFDASAAEAAGFEARLNYKDGTYSVVTNDAHWELDTSSIGTAVLTVTYLDFDGVIFYDMNIYVVTITSLDIDLTDVKTAYVEGDALDLSNLTITGYDSSNNHYPLQVNDCEFSPNNGSILSISDTAVTITYVNEDNSTATTSYSISVSAFIGFTKVTSEADLTVGDSYVIGVENINHSTDLMGNMSGSIRSRVDASNVFSVDGTKIGENAPTSTGAVVVTLLSDGNGKYAFYDITNNKYIGGRSTASDNTISNHDSLSSAGVNAWWEISFEDGLMSVTLNDSTRVFAYNIGSPRFATYNSYAANSTTVKNGNAHPILFKMNGSAVEDSVTSFANNSLKMNDDYYAGDNETPECAENYGNMTVAYILLSDAEKNVFQYSDDFAAARARLNNWATANGQTFNYGNDEPFESLRKIGSNGSILSPEDDSSLIILFIICTLGAGALSAFYLMKKKKRA